MATNILDESIPLDTPLSALTVGQMLTLIKDSISVPSEKRYARSMGELAEYLGTSASTCYRMKAAGLLDEAISQSGRWQMIDVDKVIELMRLGKNKRRR